MSIGQLENMEDMGIQQQNKSVENQAISPDLAENLNKLKGLAEKKIKVPGIGEIPLTQLPEYLPMYVALTKNKTIRDMIPPEVHSVIMEFAYLTGAEEKPRGKTKLADIPLPRDAIIKTLMSMRKEGWGETQIAKQLNLPVTTVHNLLVEGEKLRNEGKLRYIVKTKIHTWLSERVEKRLTEQLQLTEELIQRAETREAEKRRQQHQKP